MVKFRWRPPTSAPTRFGGISLLTGKRKVPLAIESDSTLSYIPLASRLDYCSFKLRTAGVSVCSQYLGTDTKCWERM
jgi:hypothetical protein